MSATRKLRKVRDRIDVIRVDDHNLKVEALKEDINTLESMEHKLKITNPYLDEKEKLKSMVQALPTVKSGDYVMADHHNKIVDCLNQVLKVLDAIEIDYDKAYEEGYEIGYGEGRDILTQKVFLDKWNHPSPSYTILNYSVGYSLI